MSTSETKEGVYTLFHAPGMGSTFTLALLSAFNAPHEVITLDFDSIARKQEDTPEYRKLKAVNPLCQFPTLVTPEGAATSEMAGIALYLHDKFAEGTPWSTKKLSTQELAVFYRLMFYIPANIYPTITMIDFPSRFIVVPETADLHVSKEAAIGWISEKALENREASFKVLESIIVSEAEKWEWQGPFVLGTEHPTILDVYITLVSHYSPRPRFSWLKTHCPRIWGIADNTMRVPIVGDIFLKSFKDASDDDPWPLEQ